MKKFARGPGEKSVMKGLCPGSLQPISAKVPAFLNSAVYLDSLKMLDPQRIVSLLGDNQIHQIQIENICLIVRGSNTCMGLVFEKNLVARFVHGWLSYFSK
jgi:hypothetical protein